MSHYNPGHISKILNGGREVTAQVATDLDRVLDAGGELAATLVSRDGAPCTNDLVSKAAGEASEHAELIEASELGPGALEQLRADIAHLARSYVIAPPMPLFLEMEQVRRRVFRAMKRKSYPRQTSELYLLAGALCALMANASLDLGRSTEADKFARSAWIYGGAAAHPGLMGWARGMQALVALIDGRPDDAVDYASKGLSVQSAGMGGARLYSMSARALAGCSGHEREALDALALARTAGEHATADDLYHELRGEFVFDSAKQQYYEALILVQLGKAQEAEIAATKAQAFFQSRPPEDRSYGCQALAQLQLALARLISGELEGAGEALRPIFELPPNQRISSLMHNVTFARNILDDSRFQGSTAARDLTEQFEAFHRSTQARALPSG